MAKGKWTFLHRSERYIYYYRRAIPEFLRPTFNNNWEIKRSLKTRDKTLAILRHNELNIRVERLLSQAKMGDYMGKGLSSILKELDDKKDFLAGFEVDPKKALWSGIAALLRGKPILETIII